MTSKEIKSLARTKLLEEGTELVSDTTLDIYLNLAYKDVIKSAYPKSAVTEVTLTFTNGVATLPGNYGTLYTDAYDSENNIFPEVSIGDFIRLDDNANGVTVEAGTMKVSPTDTTSLNIKYH